MLPMKTDLPARALRIVPYLTPDEVQQLRACCPRGRQQEPPEVLGLDKEMANYFVPISSRPA